MPKIEENLPLFWAHFAVHCRYLLACSGSYGFMHHLCTWNPVHLYENCLLNTTGKGYKAIDVLHMDNSRIPLN